MRVFLNGATGAIGSLLSKQLVLKGVEVFTDEADLKFADRVIHLAAKSPPADAKTMTESNIIYLLRTIEKMSKFNIKDMIFFSAASIYGDIQQEIVTESSPLGKMSLYSSSKLFGENILKASGLNVLCLRLPAVLTLRSTTNLPARIFETAKKDERITLYNADSFFNNFISVDEISSFITNLSEINHFDIINLRTGTQITLNDFAKLIVKETASRSTITSMLQDSIPLNMCINKSITNYGFKPAVDNAYIIDWIKNKLK